MLHRHPFLSLLTGAYLAFVAWLTLSPQESVAPATDWGLRGLDALHRRGHLRSVSESEMEFLANVGLFVPVGVFLLLLFGAGGWWLAAIGSMAMTGFIEAVQHQIPGRVPDDRDLVANTVGALIGIAIALVLTMPATVRRRRRRRARARDWQHIGAP